VAEAHDFAFGQPRLTPVWPNAYLGGRVAGFNMAGSAVDYLGGTATNSMKYFGVDISSAGITVPPDDSYQVLRRRQNGSYRRVVVKDGCVVGLVFAGDIEKSGIVFRLMKECVDVSEFMETLVADDFGLTCLPEDMWRPQLTAQDEVSK
jgi:NAD(P)H-nitrite reductase large subunit